MKLQACGDVAAEMVGREHLQCCYLRGQVGEKFSLLLNMNGFISIKSLQFNPFQGVIMLHWRFLKKESGF